MLQASARHFLLIKMDGKIMVNSQSIYVPDHVIKRENGVRVLCYVGNMQRWKFAKCELAKVCIGSISICGKKSWWHADDIWPLRRRCKVVNIDCQCKHSPVDEIEWNLFEWIQIGWMYDFKKIMKRNGQRIMLALGISGDEEMVSARVTGMTNKKSKLAKVWIYWI